MSNTQQLQERFEQRCKLVRSDNSWTASVWKLGEWFMENLKAAIQESDLASIPKEQLLDLVDRMYDKYILPLDLPGPDVIIDPFLKRMITSQASALWESTFRPAQQANSIDNLL